MLTMSLRHLAATRLTDEEMRFLREIVEKTRAETISDALRFCVKLAELIQKRRALLVFPYDFLGDIAESIMKRKR